jgi:hypothetical protein
MRESHLFPVFAHQAQPSSSDDSNGAAVISWLAKRILSHNMAKLRAGDYRPPLRGEAKDVRFRFPGTSSFATELEGKEALEQWLRRFVDIGPADLFRRNAAQGPPWRSTLCVRGKVFLDDASGEQVYNNRYVIWGRMAWGLIREHEVYEDTEQATACDHYLATREQPTPSAAV